MSRVVGVLVFSIWIQGRRVGTHEGLEAFIIGHL